MLGCQCRIRITLVLNGLQFVPCSLGAAFGFTNGFDTALLVGLAHISGTTLGSVLWQWFGVGLVVAAGPIACLGIRSICFAAQLLHTQGRVKQIQLLLQGITLGHGLLRPTRGAPLLAQIIQTLQNLLLARLLRHLARFSINPFLGWCWLVALLACLCNLLGQCLCVQLVRGARVHRLRCNRTQRTIFGIDAHGRTRRYGCSLNGGLHHVLNRL